MTWPELGRQICQNDWKARNAASISFSITALIRKGRMDQKACKNLLCVGMRLYIYQILSRYIPKCEHNAWTHTHKHTLSSLLDLENSHHFTIKAFTDHAVFCFFCFVLVYFSLENSTGSNSALTKYVSVQILKTLITDNDTQ